MISRINLCVLGCPPAPVYKGAKGRGGRPGLVRQGGSPTPTGSRTPSFPNCRRRRGERGGRGEGKGGRRPPSLVLFGLGRGGARGLLLPLSLFHLKAHVGPIIPRGVPVTPRYSGKMPISPGTIPMSKYRLPIYQSLCLDHFETPRHVRDHIRDSELLRYIKIHKLIITVIETLSVRTLRFENNVDMTETRLRSITNSGTWMPILAPTYSTKIFIGQTAQQHTLFPLSSVCYLPEIRSSVSNT